MTEITTFGGRTTQVDGTALAEEEVVRLLRQVGERVRHVRERKGIPRRVLSELSGVSPRYLAQLESGEGNISISLLKRVALALNHRIEWFVGEDDPWNSDVLRVAEAFRSADRATREAVLRSLTREDDAGQGHAMHEVVLSMSQLLKAHGASQGIEKPLGILGLVDGGLGRFQAHGRLLGNLRR